MNLIKGNQPNLDLSRQPGVTDIFCSVNNGIIIHLRCNEGDEKKVIDNLPKWVFDELNVVEGHRHVFLERKK